MKHGFSNADSPTEMCEPGPGAAKGPVPAAAENALAARLLEEMGAAWQRGERPRAEDFLVRHPELYDAPEAAIQLIYEEVCLCEEVGEATAPSDILRRFPQWQTELEVLLSCHRLMQPPAAATVFPKAGQAFEDLVLLAELGRGGQGRVFLAREPQLANRRVVLKLTTCGGQEHLSLARLQHTHIVPLFWARDFPQRNLRALCMPYLGGLTLADLLKRLRSLALEQRTGKDLLKALDQAVSPGPDTLPQQAPARNLLSTATYVQGVCWVGVCLAKALQYAHDRGLVHLDLKPSNVLLAVDGQPMLLDFHLARACIKAAGPVPEWFGGTPEYMSPEQRLALAAVRQARPIPKDVDHRSDIYSLGLLLYQALGGTVAPAEASSSNGVTPRLSERALHQGKALPGDLSRPRLDQCNPDVSVGLADVISKCLAHDPARRYGDAATLAADLRRHLADLPLQGVPNRSLRERWRKWRRRRPDGLGRMTRLGIVLVLLTTGLAALFYFNNRLRKTETALVEQGRDLRRQLDDKLRDIQRTRMAVDLATLTEQVRFLRGAFPFPGALQASEAHLERQVQKLEKPFHKLWKDRDKILDRRGAELEPDVEKRIRTDLLDLVILWQDLRLQLAPANQAAQVREETLQMLSDVEARFGLELLQDRLRHNHAQHLWPGPDAPGAAADVPMAWNHYVEGRRYLRNGDLDEAAQEFERAVELNPQDFWSHLYQGICARQRGCFDEAVPAFRVCIALATDKLTKAECYYHLTLAYEAQRNARAFQESLQRVLELNPKHQAALALLYRERTRAVGGALTFAAG